MEEIHTMVLKKYRKRIFIKLVTSLIGKLIESELDNQAIIIAVGGLAVLI